MMPLAENGNRWPPTETTATPDEVLSRTAASKANKLVAGKRIPNKDWKQEQAALSSGQVLTDCEIIMINDGSQEKLALPFTSEGKLAQASSKDRSNKQQLLVNNNINEIVSNFSTKQSSKLKLTIMMLALMKMLHAFVCFPNQAFQNQAKQAIYSIGRRTVGHVNRCPAAMLAPKIASITLICYCLAALVSGGGAASGRPQLGLAPVRTAGEFKFS